MYWDVWDLPAHGSLQVDFSCASQAVLMENLPSPFSALE